MRIPLTPHGVREMLLFGGGALLLAAAAFLVHPAAAVPFVALAVFVLSFFRDPERKPPPGEDVAVAPADGKVTDIEEVDEPFFLGGRALRIGIFLSVFNVHVNRAPLAGNGAGMGEGVTDLAQRDRVVERRQIERAVGDRWTQGHEFESVGW